jgi:hypothetical protein
MPLFSSEQTDPNLKTAHRALERLSQDVQTLLCDVMTDAVKLTHQQARDLVRLCCMVRRRLRDIQEA